MSSKANQEIAKKHNPQQVSKKPRDRESKPKKQKTVAKKPDSQVVKQPQKNAVQKPKNTLPRGIPIKGPRLQGVPDASWNSRLSTSNMTFEHDIGKYNANTPALTCGAELAFALSNAAGGHVRAPYVENQGVSDMPTQVLKGRVQFNLSDDPSPRPALYQIIGFAPWAADKYIAGSPLGSTVHFTQETVVTLGEFLGNVPFTNVFGATTWADRLVPWSGTCRIAISAPACMISGTVYVGTVPVSAMTKKDVQSDMTVQNLLQRASGVYSLQETPIITLRAGISNMAGIHTDGSTTASTNEINEEFISYAIFVNPARSVLDGSLAYFSLDVAVACNAIVSPDGAQPSLAGMAAPDIMENHISPERSLVEHLNAQELRKLNHCAELPSNWDKIVDYCEKGISIAGMIAKGVGLMGGGLSTAMSMLLIDKSARFHPLTKSANVTADAINTLKWFNRKLIPYQDPDDYPIQAVAAMTNAWQQINVAIDVLSRLSKAQKSWMDNLPLCETKEFIEGGKSVLRYYRDGQEYIWTDPLEDVRHQNDTSRAISVDSFRRAR